MKNKNRENRGITLISLILLILIFILIGFLIYEFIFVDILGIRDTNSNPITATLNKQGNIIVQEYDDTNSNVVNTEPIIDQNQLNGDEIVDINKQYSRYYYNQLDKNAKIIYKGIEDNIENMRTGTYKIDFETTFSELLNTEDGEKKLNEAFQSAWNALTYDHMDIFYIDVTKLVLTTQTTTIGNYSTHKVYLSNGNNESYLSEGFTYELLQEQISRLEGFREQVVTTLNSYTTYEQIKHVHNWLVDNIEYDTTYQKENIYNIYGTLTTGNAVCEGYARTYKYILDELKIPCVLVSGTATNSNGETELHAWNDVNINGKWYAIDPTWDDPILIGGSILTTESRYRYFLKGSNEFFQNHKENGRLSENSIEFAFPTLEKEDYE